MEKKNRDRKTEGKNNRRYWYGKIPIAEYLRKRGREKENKRKEILSTKIIFHFRRTEKVTCSITVEGVGAWKRKAIRNAHFSIKKLTINEAYSRVRTNAQIFIVKEDTFPPHFSFLFFCLVFSLQLLSFSCFCVFERTTLYRPSAR